jgi:N-sulfoglucosamine sulfohydrolase
MFSGLISHNNKVEGFYKVTDPGWPHMVDLLQEAGYYAGIHGKVTHSSPYQPYGWDDDLTIYPPDKRLTLKMPKHMGSLLHGELKQREKSVNLSFFP